MRAALLLLLLAGPGDEPIKWIPLEEARARAAATGKPVLVWSISALLVDGPPTKGLDEAFKSELVRVQKDDFLFVKATAMSTIKAVKATSKCELIVIDPDGDEIARTIAKSIPEIAAAMKAATKAYADRPVNWTLGAPSADTAGSRRPMTVVLFADGSAASEAAARSLEDRRVAKLHDRCDFIRLEGGKDSAEAKAWNVSTIPVLLLLDSAKEFGPKAVVERSSERKTPREMRSFLGRGLASIEKARK